MDGILAVRISDATRRPLSGARRSAGSRVLARIRLTQAAAWDESQKPTVVAGALLLGHMSSHQRPN
jgi:hypothetical protein